VLVDELLQLFLRATQRLRPVPYLIVLVHIDADAVLRASVGEVVGYWTLLGVSRDDNPIA
jgi:hypothetical protein